MIYVLERNAGNKQCTSHNNDINIVDHGLLLEKNPDLPEEF
jgi:hypothetical protein